MKLNQIVVHAYNKHTTGTKPHIVEMMIKLSLSYLYVGFNFIKTLLCKTLKEV